MFRKLSDIFNAALQPTRAALDFAALHLQWDKLKDKVPEGDGHPVLFLPGFLGHDSAFRELRRCAEDKGYRTYGWENDVNFGFSEENAKHLKNRLRDVFRENKGRKVSIVGHSLGGVYARELAREFPGMVRCVVTLGSPFGLTPEGKDEVSVVARATYDFFNPRASVLEEEGLKGRCLTPPPVPTTSIYSKADGIVPWRASLNPESRKAENIQVDGGHTGMVFNPLAVAAVLDRLAQPDRGWKPFDRRHYKNIFPKAGAGVNPPANPQWKHKKHKTFFGKSRHP